MLLLIGLALFLHPRCFCLAYHYFLETDVSYVLLASSREVLHGRGVARGGHGGAFARPSLIQRYFC